jgi:hypothetical protein
MRLIAGGKRALSKGPTGKSKADVLEHLNLELKLMMLQLETYKTDPVVDSVIKEINILLESYNSLGADSMVQLLSTLKKPDLGVLSTNVSASNDQDDRLKNLWKFVFENSSNSVTQMIIRGTACEQAMKKISFMVFVASYMSENGQISWENYKARMLKLIIDPEVPQAPVKEGCTLS